MDEEKKEEDPVESGTLEIQDAEAESSAQDI